jgi:hypothetical protein
LDRTDCRFYNVFQTCHRRSIEVRGLRKDQRRIDGKRAKLGEKLVVGKGLQGTRFYPSASVKNDAKYQLRIDYGSPLRDAPDKMKVVLQVNKEADEGALKSFLKSTLAIIDTIKPAGERIIEILDQFDAASDEEASDEE